MCWNEILTPLISAGAALGGAFIGGRLTSKNQRDHRRQERVRRQLDEFYGPISGMISGIHSEGVMHKQIIVSTRAALDKELEDASDPEKKRKIAKDFRAVGQGRGPWKPL